LKKKEHFESIQWEKRAFPKIGLALGSGSARGWAHIGVIQALEESGINVDYVAGTSIGALVGAAYAAGNIDVLRDIALQLNWKQILYFFDIVFPKSGLIDGKKIADFIRNNIQERNIEELSLPFRAVSTDLATGCEVVIHEGDIVDAIRVSISIPGIFTPVTRNGLYLVDGGLVNPVPVSTVREMGADFVIAVDLNHDIIGKKGYTRALDSDFDSGAVVTEFGTRQGSIEKNSLLEALEKKIKTLDLPVLTQINQWRTRDPIPSIFDVLISSICIMEAQITNTKLKTDPPDLLIQPDLGHIKLLEFNRAEEAIAEGYTKTKDQIYPLIEKGGQLAHP